MGQTPSSAQPNTLGNVSLGLGVVSSATVFAVGICALIGVQQGWLALLGTVLLVCGATSAFVAFIGLVVGAGGLFGAGRTKATAVIGVILNVIGMCIFFGALAAIRGA